MMSWPIVLSDTNAKIECFTHKSGNRKWKLNDNSVALLLFEKTKTFKDSTLLQASFNSSIEGKDNRYIGCITAVTHLNALDFLQKEVVNLLMYTMRWWPLSWRNLGAALNCDQLPVSITLLSGTLFISDRYIHLEMTWFYKFSSVHKVFFSVHKV